MPNPPTFNDLKRSRSLYNSTRGSRTVMGSIGIPIPIGIPSLTVPNFTFNFIGVDLNFAATGDQIGTTNLDQIDFFNLSKDIFLPTTEFYNNYRLITSTNYLFDSLYFINNSFITKSINFNDTINNLGENTLKREFYNYDSEIETDTFVLTSYDFNNLQVNLSTNVDGVTGNTDTSSFTIKVSTVHGNGKLLDNFTNYNLQGDYNAPLISFTSLSTFDYVIPVDPVSPIVDDNYSLTLSTERNDGTTGLYENIKNLSINISAAPYREALDNSIYTTWSLVSSLSNPLDEYATLSGVYTSDTEESRRDVYPGKFFFQQEYFRPDADQQFDDALDNATNERIRNKYRYVNNRKTESANWNTEWFLYPYRDVFDLSGVTLTRDNNSTLIAGKFAVSNTHFGGGGQYVGDTLKFLTRDGNIVSTTIESKRNIGFDCRLVKLADDVTDLGDVKLYKLPLFENPVNRNKTFPCFYQSGNYSLGKLRNPDFTGRYDYSEGDEYAGISAIGTMTNVAVSADVGGYVDYTALQSVSSVFENKKLGLPGQMLANGDSSSPLFIIHNNDILLFTTFKATGFQVSLGGVGNGPGYHTKSFHDALTANMEILGNTEGYELSTVKLS
tara:strand:- start:247 stop:2085 length:1839 start_codon:yes stop_codon:yes gene_type:complete